MKRKDDFDRTIDKEDNLTKMILIEQAIDTSFEIDDEISRSYAFCDCVMAIVEFAKETANEAPLERIKELLEQIHNKGAYVRALAYYALGLASFEHEEEASEYLALAIEFAHKIKDDFDRRDAFLEIATTAADISFLTDEKEIINLPLKIAEYLTNGQKAYLLGYLSTILDEPESESLMNEAKSIANKIKDPITKSKVLLELASLLTNYRKFES